MSETGTTPNSDLAGKNGALQLGSTLLNNSPTQAGVMVMIVAMVGQAFAHFHQMAAPGAALLFSFLLAIYQIWRIQTTTLLERLIAIPIAAFILFALALAANNTIAPSPENLYLEKKLELVEKQLQARSEELQNARDLIKEFRAVLGLQQTTSRSQNNSLYQPNDGLRRSKASYQIVELFGSLISQAHAQPADLKNEKQRELREALSKYKTRQEALEREQKRLQDEQERLRKAQQKIQQKAPLWRKW